MSPSQNRDSSTFHFYWRRLFFVILYHLLLLLLFELRNSEIMIITAQNEWMKELWKMLSCRIFHLTLNCSMWRDECRQFIMFLLLSLSFPFWLFFSLLSLSFHKFSSIHLLKNSYSMFIHPATYKKGGRIRSSRGNSIMMMNEQQGREWMNERQNLIEWMNKNYEYFYNKMR